MPFDFRDFPSQQWTIRQFRRVFPGLRVEVGCAVSIVGWILIGEIYSPSMLMADLRTLWLTGQHGQALFLASLVAIGGCSSLVPWLAIVWDVGLYQRLGTLMTASSTLLLFCIYGTLGGLHAKGYYQSMPVGSVRLNLFLILFDFLMCSVLGYGVWALLDCREEIAEFTGSGKADLQLLLLLLAITLAVMVVLPLLGILNTPAAALVAINLDCTLACCWPGKTATTVSCESPADLP